MTETLDLDALRLDRGMHREREDGVCLMEAVAWFAGQEHTDRPPCVSPVLANFGIALNDQWDEETRQQLKPFIPRLPGTAGDGLDTYRGYLALDWMIRTYTVAWLDLAGLADEATALRELEPVTSLKTAQQAGAVVRRVAPVMDAAGAATWAAARAAAGDAAGAAAWDAAGAAAWDAARDAAGAATRSAAWSAAGAAARDAAGAAARSAAGDAAWDAAGDAAGAAAGAAAGDAAWDAAGAAAGDAARDAAWDAARAAARSAAWSAARAAAGAKLAPTVALLQASALELFGRMIDAG